MLSGMLADEVTDAVRIERDGRILLITLNRPDARNAVNEAVTQGLEAAVDELENDEELWAGILAGTGPVFCAGADLKAVAAGRLASLSTERGGFAGFVRRGRSKPIIAAVHADAVAGGMELAIACDLIVAAAGSRMGIPEVARSLLAAGGALAELPRLIGEKAALELAITGAPWPVERLADLGLISRVVPAESVLAEARQLADSICGNAPLAVRASRRAIIDGRDLDSAARWDLVNREFGALIGTEDFAEGPRAFVETRPPRWSAR
jgi:enoyl-CoA hydratase